MKSFLIALVAFVAMIAAARAQNNYEIQVYGSETVAPKTTMVELHSNFTADGQKNFVDGMEPDNHAEHETVEITQGINGWSEVGFYIFTSAGRAGISVGGGPYPAEGARAAELGLAGGGEPFDRGGLPAGEVRAGHVGLGDQADY